MRLRHAEHFWGAAISIWHTSHCAAPTARAYRPGAHSVQSNLAADGCALPLPHAVHDNAAYPRLNWPAGQSLHDVRLRSGWYWPGEQLTHILLPS